MNYYIEAVMIEQQPAYLVVRADDARPLGWRRTWREADAYMQSIADPPGAELMMTHDGWKYGLIAPGDRSPREWSKSFPSHETCLQSAREAVTA